LKESGPDYWGCTKVAVHTTDKNMSIRCPIDAHGMAVVDLDGDGVKDVYVAAGANGGKGDAEKFYSAALLWGQKGPSKSPLELVGGRPAAIEAGLGNTEGSGRFSYVLDANGDGLYDLVTANEPRGDEVFAPGRLFLQTSPRTFAMQPDWAEFATSMLLTDLDGDGRVAELVIVRYGECLPGSRLSRKGAIPQKGGNAEELRKHCKAHPPTSTVVYDVGKKQGLTFRAQIGKASDLPFKAVQSVQALDLDGDGRQDLAVLRSNVVEVHLSSKRKVGSLPDLDAPDKSIDWRPSQGGGKTETKGKMLRVADFDLDGTQDLLVLSAASGCSSGGSSNGGPCTTHRIIQWVDGTLRDGTNSALGKAARALPLQDAVPDKTTLRSACDHFKDVAWGQKLPIIPVFKQSCDWADAGKADAYNMMGGSVVDFNSDGYADLTLSYSFGKMLFLRNTLHGNNFLAVRLKSSMPIVGASLLLTVSDGGGGGNRTLLREVNAVSHETDWEGQRDDRTVFGLGASGVPLGLTVRWPGGATRRVGAKALVTAANSMTSPLEVVHKAPH